MFVNPPAQEIARHKLPERLAIVTSFPLSPVGKVSKKDLAAMLAEAGQAQGDGAALVNMEGR